MNVPVHAEYAAAGGFAHLPLGKQPRRDDPRTLRLARYLNKGALPPAPSACDWVSGVGTAWPMYGNDRLADCTIAAAAHMVQAWSNASGKMVTPAEKTVEDAYWATGSQDDGRIEVSVLAYWRRHGIGSHHRIGAFASVDVGDLDEVRAAIWLFGGVYAGLALPQTAQAQKVWDVVPHAGARGRPGTWGGHAVPYLAYDGANGTSTFTCVTWGAPLTLTGAFHLAYCDEAYAVIGREWLEGGDSPNGFNKAALLADLAALG